MSKIQQILAQILVQHANRQTTNHVLYYNHKERKEVLKMIASGAFNKEIASTLNISERTVKNHVSNIFKKIGVSDRTQAAVFAIKNDIISIK